MFLSRFVKEIMQILYVFAKKQVKISASGGRKIILFSLWIKIIFITPLADIFTCFKQKLTKFWSFFFRKLDIIS